MAQALLHDPPLLVMDEPTSGLDPIQIRHFRAHVRELGQQKTLVVSTHILQEVSAIADRVLLIYQGRLVFDGTPRDIGSHDSLEALFYALTGAGTPEPAMRTRGQDSASLADGTV
jgi:ABC-2 type transport system ATP-binding protein